jgi:hypothetical protein
MNGKTYKEFRQDNYPGVGEQLDMLWHMIDQGLPLDKTSAFYKAIAAIKNQFPKS